MTAQSIFSHRISIITGHYGTGKTELAVNLALALAGEGCRVMLADLDIVNPYFRSRERRPRELSCHISFPLYTCSSVTTASMSTSQLRSSRASARWNS